MIKNGTKVLILATGWSDLIGEYGIVKGFDGEAYLVAPMGGRETILLNREDFRVPRSKG